jgi:hypothetical protein
MQTATDLGNLEAILANTARANGVSAEVYSMNDSVHADIDAGHAGGITLRNDQYNSNVLAGTAHSYIANGNSSIREALSRVGIPSSLVDAGPEGDVKQVQFLIPYHEVEGAVNALYSAFRKIDAKGA